MTVLREMLIGIAVLAGAALTVVGLVAAGWWAWAILGGSAMVVFGLSAAGRPDPDEDD